ncbi:hypothetical protein BE17_49395 [Sorangium cellulosum]|uniref:Uncharacterized protein n=1 Tax=Sorangium cellulosum TaxID=56 RepID=A0A150RVV5_SORCE|nr:hypothetical protein BE17_49395 [Sorangium cellulosum]
MQARDVGLLCDARLQHPGDLRDLLALADQEKGDALPGSYQPELGQEITRLDGTIYEDGICCLATWCGSAKATSRRS